MIPLKDSTVAKLRQEHPPQWEVIRISALAQKLASDTKSYVCSLTQLLVENFSIYHYRGRGLAKPGESDEFMTNYQKLHENLLKGEDENETL